MIIQVCGTSGSGKSTVLRSLLERSRAASEAALDHEKWAVMTEGRRSPLGYRFCLVGCPRPIFVPGAYESPTGGCDTIKGVEPALEVVRERVTLGEDVVAEGLFIMNMTRCPALLCEVAVPWHLVHLDTPLDECFRRILARRQAVGDVREDGVARPLTDVNRRNIRGNFVRARNYCDRMRRLGATVTRCPTEGALDVIMGLLTGGGENGEDISGAALG